jgi:hypothetical protein
LQQIVRELGLLSSPSFKSIGITGFTSAGFVKNDASGTLSGGNTIAVGDLPAHATEHESGGSDTVDHDSLTGFVSDEHVAHSGVSISAGGILSGGGTIAANRTISLAHGDVDHDQTANFVPDEHVAHSGVTFSAGTGLTGGGDLSANRSFAVDGVLEDLDTLGPATADGKFIVATGAGVFAYESGNTARTSLGLGTSDSPQFSQVGVGDPALSQTAVYAKSAQTHTDATVGYGIRGTLAWTPSSNASGYGRACDFTAQTYSANDFSGYMVGLWVLAEHKGTGTLEDQYGLYLAVQNDTTGTINDQYGIRMPGSNVSGGTVGDYFGLYHSYNNGGTISGSSYFLYDTSGFSNYLGGTLQVNGAFTGNSTGEFSSTLTASGITSEGRLNCRAVSDTTAVEQMRIGRTGSDIRYHSMYAQHSSGSSSWLEFRIHDGGSSPYTAQNTVLTLYGSTPLAYVSGDLRATGDVRADTAFNLNGTDGVSGTYDFYNDGTSGNVTQITVSGGIITSVTTAP